MHLVMQTITLLWVIAAALADDFGHFEEESHWAEPLDVEVEQAFNAWHITEDMENNQQSTAVSSQPSTRQDRQVRKRPVRWRWLHKFVRGNNKPRLWHYIKSWLHLHCNVSKPPFQKCLQVGGGLWANKVKVLAAVTLLSVLRSHIRIQLEKRSSLRAFSCLNRSALDITIVTSAALPWKTGTAVNAVLRAANLAMKGHTVTLCVPWIHPLEQQAIFPSGCIFDTPLAQAQYICE
eukprot:gnl/MRDRNA2_/MRDRNA2_35000_c0_seq1.p1 gnl/MRDRNA2_/MRDRNA2_35000_c0~~gnl/MRDRNA2_/MRDRNA2_35000_c0_seq1.p1  ORF type:complete len:235 (+),score=34.76 gnl/MRDRNA2_/MRDRNA2_35000_c0_seq1:201-905(+)